MYDHWAPPELWVMEPVYYNFVENIVTVQWIHRVIGTLLGLLVIAIWIRTYTLKLSFQLKMWSLALFTGVLLQYLIGVFTLLFHVPLWLGVLHQVMALSILGVAIAFMNRLRYYDLRE